MASQIREWSGINTFAPATQTKLLELLGNLKQENVNSLTILVMGKGGVGKSSTVNSIIGERVVSISPFQTIDVLLYVDRLDVYRVDNLDKLVAKAITDSFGKGIWNKAIVTLTHAQFSPPDGLPYDEFFSQRSESLLKVLRSGARIKKEAFQAASIPVVLVENSGRCNKNDSDEKVLPNGTAWIPNLVQTITEIALNKSESIHVDKNLIEGPNPNQRGKLWIPLVFALQIPGKYSIHNVIFWHRQAPIQSVVVFANSECVDFGLENEFSVLFLWLFVGVLGSLFKPSTISCPILTLLVKGA
ncbi:hypothetical protein JHK82_053402 [Glycine max]|nr:hypothetical protein JHK82_053402 [Glycine max]